MRRSTIWILIALMVITFGALIALQVRYLSGTAQMASSQFDQAMLAADQHIGDLEDDTETLRYLTRAALAAGDPAKAAYYARRLVFQRVPVRGTS